MRRARNFEEYLAVSARFATEEGWARGLAFQPHPSDIIISPYAKCGTTWMQQIVHGLRSGGDMSFGEITQAVPWIEMAHDLALDLSAAQFAAPRAFKSHLGWEDVPKGARYIVVLRDPLDAMVSLFRFMEGWFFDPGAVQLEEFARYYVSRHDKTDYWSHALGWWGQRNNPDVLLFGYEHMKQDLPDVVARVADFMGGYDEDRVALALRQAGFDFMKAHAGQFDDNYLKRLRDPAMGLPAGSPAVKVSTGQSGTGAAALLPETRAAFARKWADTMGAQYGLKDYPALLDALRA